MKRVLREMLLRSLRAPLKAIISFIAAMLTIIAISQMRISIIRTQIEIQRLYNTIPVHASIKPRSSIDSAPFHDIGNLIRAWAVHGILDIENTYDAYLESGHSWAIITPCAADRSLPEDWLALAGVNRDTGIIDNTYLYDTLLAVSDTDIYISRNSKSFVDEIPGISRYLSDGSLVEDLVITYAPGYGESSFMYADNKPIPVIVSEKTMEERGISYGDTVFISYAILTSENFSIISWESWQHRLATVIGSHNRNIINNHMRDATLLPLAAMENMLYNEIGYMTLDFLIQSADDNDPAATRDTLIGIAEDTRAGWVALSLSVRDEELKAAVGSLEKTLALLEFLYPITFITAVVIGFGIAILLMNQYALNAAIMRVLGLPGYKIVLIYLAEFMLINILGIIAGITVLQIFRQGFIYRDIPVFTGAYLMAVLAGSVIGAWLITHRSPLELLQVRE